MLETGFANSMVRRVCEKKINVVEINPLPIIKYEKNHILKGNAENIVPKLIDQFFANTKVGKPLQNVKNDCNNVYK